MGVGSCLTLDHLPNGIQYTGVDINQKMLTLAHANAWRLKRKQITLALMDAHKLKIRAGSFDLVIAASVITAVEDPEATMREKIRVTKSGGHIAVIANLRDRKSYRSSIVRRMDPLTKRFLGFRTDIDAGFFAGFKGLREVRNEALKILLGFPLSSFVLLKKN
jgi:phosphatidylethanolamine/phosphatidyl-N-methylethanolamine N-methyltransferase